MPQQNLTVVRTSKQFSLASTDWLKAFLIGALGAVWNPVVSLIVATLDNNSFAFNWPVIGASAFTAFLSYVTKNYFTPSQTVITGANSGQKLELHPGDGTLSQVVKIPEPGQKVSVSKVAVILLIATMGVMSAHGQSFFKHVKLEQPHAKQGKFGSTVTLTDSTFFAIRPVVNIAALSVPSLSAMAGAGFGYQNLTYNYASQKTYCNWSINALMFAGGNLAPSKPTATLTYALMLGAFNNLFMVGAGINDGKLQGIVSIGISLN